MEGDPSKIPDHFIHLIGIDRGIVPLYTVASLTDVTSNLTLSHAANELIPRGLQTLTVDHTCFRCVVQEFIVPDPEGSVPGFLVCPTVHAVSFVWFVWYMASIGPRGGKSC